jgi:hypothetical protein
MQRVICAVPLLYWFNTVYRKKSLYSTVSNTHLGAYTSSDGHVWKSHVSCTKWDLGKFVAILVINSKCCDEHTTVFSLVLSIKHVYYLPYKVIVFAYKLYYSFLVCGKLTTGDDCLFLDGISPVEGKVKWMKECWLMVDTVTSVHYYRKWKYLI